MPGAEKRIVRSQKKIEQNKKVTNRRTKIGGSLPCSASFAWLQLKYTVYSKVYRDFSCSGITVDV